jgi:hypothetical protein
VLGFKCIIPLLHRSITPVAGPTFQISIAAGRLVFLTGFQLLAY